MTSVRFSPDLLAKIDAWRATTSGLTRSAAYKALIELGLTVSQQVKEAGRK